MIKSFCGESCGCGFCPATYPSPPPSPPFAPACTSSALDLVLVLDHSGSMLAFQDQVLEFARELVFQFELAPAAARVGLVDFEETAQLLANLSTHAEPLMAALQIEIDVQG